MAAAPTPSSNEALNAQIEEALDTIRPYLAADGGAVRLLNVTDDMVVELELLGACGTCPMSMMPLRAGIEQAMVRSLLEQDHFPRCCERTCINLVQIHP